MIKKKAEKARAYFEAYKDLQKLVIKEASLVSSSNNRPMICIQVAGPESIRDGVSAVKQWQQRAGIDATVFKGKATLTQMLELPIRSAYQAILAMMKVDSRAAREKGLSTKWLDQERRWSIALNG